MSDGWWAVGGRWARYQIFHFRRGRRRKKIEEGPYSGGRTVSHLIAAENIEQGYLSFSLHLFPNNCLVG